MTSATAGLPIDLGRWSHDVLLADGGTVHVRPITPEDGPRLVALHGRLSAETIYLRFFSPHPTLTPAEVRRFTHLDYDDRMAFVATLGDDIVAVARYDRLPGTDEAEVAFVVEDAHQGRGIGTLLLEHLAAYARTRGIRRFVADTLAHNRRMLNVFREAGYEEEVRLDGEVVRVTLSIEPTEAAEAAASERDRHATVRSVERLLAPRSIAVIGASRERGTIGHEIFRNLLAAGFTGPVYPVHPTAPHVASVRAYPTVLDVPDDVDLAVVVVPAERVLEVVEQCGRKRVRGLVVISAGFAETGPAGRAAERELVALARGWGMRLVGPNCMGVINTDPAVSMNATFAPVPPLPGPVAFLSQSGGLGIAILEEAARLGIGVSSFVSVGNKADVSGNDLIQYWEQDPRTSVILLYLESFGNPRKFGRIARRVSRTKPIVAVKGGRTQAGSRGASSHTAAMATPEVAVDALFHQAGVIRVDTLEELFAVSQVLSTQPVPAGRRVGIVGNAGGPGILAADACEGAGLSVPELSEATQAALRSFLPPTASVRNPVDMVASATAADYERALRTVLDDPGIDAVIVMFTPPLVTRADDVARAIASAAEGAAKPVVANFLAQAGTPELLRAGSRVVPSFAFPETAARALAAAARYGEWRARPEGTVPVLDGIDRDGARGVVEEALAAHPEGCWLDAEAAARLLGAFGIPVAALRRVGSAEEAAAAAVAMGFPVALKAAAPDLVHKSDVGGVRLGLASPEEVRRAYEEMAAALGERMGGAVVQRMVPAGVETIVGVLQDPAFGPLVMFGTGGTAVELFGDRAFRILPLTDLDAAELVRATKGSPLLFGYRGAPPADVDALCDVLLRVAALADEVPAIAEADCNPVIVSPAGAVVVDAKVRLAPHRPAPEEAVRRLR
jgi:acetyl coenzyme A synthetase (ADP forming)-like protein